MRRTLSALAALVLLAPLATGAAQQPARKPSDPLPAIPMPQDRADDSYRLYSSLLPAGETVSTPPTQLLVQDTTLTLLPTDKPCAQPATPSPSPTPDASLNPHLAIHPPAANHQDLVEVLDDFDQHCHDRLTLNPDPNVWKLAVPIRLLNPAEQDEFRASHGRADAPDKFQGASALYAFSEVYFNAHHTVAIVYATHWCGKQCVQGSWAAFTLDNSQVWQRQPSWTNSN
jgi:hypothetical protein